jgi:hypothetical protein
MRVIPFRFNRQRPSQSPGQESVNGPTSSGPADAGHRTSSVIRRLGWGLAILCVWPGSFIVMARAGGLTRGVADVDMSVVIISALILAAAALAPDTHLD